MQEVAVLVYCDVCFKESSTRVKADYGEVVSLGNTTRRLELCDDHKAEVIPRLSEVLAYGSKVDARPKGVGRPAKAEPAVTTPDDDQAALVASMTCPRCGDVFKSRTHVMAHARDAHEPPLTMEEMRVLAPDRDLYECDQPDCGVVSIGLLGKSTHLRITHGIDKRQRELQDA